MKDFLDDDPDVAGSTAAAELRLAALHEAGCAVARHRIFAPDVVATRTVSVVSESYPFERITPERIRARRAYARGLVPARHARERAVVAMAGCAAAQAAGHGAGYAGCGCDLDPEMLAEATGRCGGYDARAEARELMTRPENLRAVARLADALLASGMLEAPMVEILIADADRESAPEDHEEG